MMAYNNVCLSNGKVKYEYKSVLSMMGNNVRIIKLN
jgi:hypothetical protein